MLSRNGAGQFWRAKRPRDKETKKDQSGGLNDPSEILVPEWKPLNEAKLRWLTCAVPSYWLYGFDAGGLGQDSKTGNRRVNAISYGFFYNTAFTIAQALGTGMADFFHMNLSG